MNFLLGVLSSIIATALIFIASRISLQWAKRFPRGVQFILPTRHRYVSEIANLIRKNRDTFFFKGLTGYDLFSADLIRSALQETRVDTWKQLVFILTDPRSPSFDAEPNKFYTSERLRAFQKIVVDFLTERLIANALPTTDCTRGIFYVPEERTFINLLVLDSVAYVFFRGFTDLEGPAGQSIVRIDLSKCPPLLRQLIIHVREDYIERCMSSGTSSAAIATEIRPSPTNS